MLVGVVAYRVPVVEVALAEVVVLAVELPGAILVVGLVAEVVVVEAEPFDNFLDD